MEPISIVSTSQHHQVFSSPRTAAAIMERNYERIDVQTSKAAADMMAAAAAVAAATPRLMDAKERKRREKEMRRLAKLRTEAELKEAKLQAKLQAKMNAKRRRGEPVPLGIIQTHRSEGKMIFYKYI